MLRIFIIINYLIRYIISILKNNTKYMGFSSNAMLIHKLETKAMGAKGKCTPLGDSAVPSLSGTATTVLCYRYAEGAERVAGPGIRSCSAA
jgi:hypothetical protein